MEPELFYLLLSVGLCGLLWIPTVVERVFRIGLAETVGNNPDDKNAPDWAIRLKSAHRNLVDNIIIFGILILILQVVEKSNNTTGFASLIFFLSVFVIYMSMVGYETKRFNKQIIKKVENINKDLKIELKEIKIILDPLNPLSKKSVFLIF